MSRKICIWLYLLTLAVIIIAGAIVSGCINYDNIHIEGYISILATLIGVLITFGVGYQILNTIEIKNEQKALKIQQEKADEKLIEVKGYIEEVKKYSTEIKNEQMKVSELLKKQMLLDNSKDKPSILLLQLDCIKLFIDLKWKEDNYGMETLKSYLEYAGCLEHGSFTSMEVYTRRRISVTSLITSFKEEYIQKIKAIKNVAVEYSLTTQINQLYLLEQCLNIQMESIVKIQSSGKTTTHNEGIYNKSRELLNEYDKLAEHQILTEKYFSSLDWEKIWF